VAVQDNGWAVEIVGSEDMLDRWTDLWPPPFDPVVEKATLPNVCGERSLLSSSRFRGQATCREVLDLAIALLVEMNGISELLEPHHPHAPPDIVHAGTMIVEFRGDGQTLGHLIIRPGTTYNRSRVFSPTLMVNGAAPPPVPTKAQRFSSVQSDVLVNGVREFGRANNWADLYKAFEDVETSGLLGQVRARLNVSKKEINRFTQTANHWRHGFDRGCLPDPPMELPEAHEFVRRFSLDIATK
jgi:hypothetical protein